MEIAKARRAHLLFPTHEQVTILSAQMKRLIVPTIVPPFVALRRMQDKISAYSQATARTLRDIASRGASRTACSHSVNNAYHVEVTLYNGTLLHARMWSRLHAILILRSSKSTRLG
jgi:hypothetical protein